MSLELLTLPLWTGGGGHKHTIAHCYTTEHVLPCSRADIKQYIGLPSMAAIFKIYHSCMRELARVGIISPTQQLLDLR